MSFDLYFLDRPEGRTWMEAMEALDLSDDGRPLSPADLETWNGLVATLTPLLPAAEAHAGDESRSFDDPDTGIEVLFCPGELSITLLDGVGRVDAPTLAETLRHVVAAVEAQTGLVAYDPQHARPYLVGAIEPDGTADDLFAEHGDGEDGAGPTAAVHHLFDGRTRSPGPRKRR